MGAAPADMIDLCWTTTVAHLLDSFYKISTAKFTCALPAVKPVATPLSTKWLVGASDVPSMID
jgi:hypothetical protein